MVMARLSLRRLTVLISLLAPLVFGVAPPGALTAGAVAATTTGPASTNYSCDRATPNAQGAPTNVPCASVWTDAPAPTNVARARADATATTTIPATASYSDDWAAPNAQSARASITRLPGWMAAPTTTGAARRSANAGFADFVAAKAASGGAELLSGAARATYRGDLTVAGRALAKHGGRPGSAFPRPVGAPADISAQAQSVVDDILANQYRRATSFNPRLSTNVVDIFDTSGRGLRYTEEGRFVGFLEPPR